MAEAVTRAAETPDQPAEPAEPDQPAERPRSRRELWQRWAPSLRTGFWTWLAGLGMYTVVTFVAWLPYQGVGNIFELQGAASQPPERALHAYEAWHQWDTSGTWSSPTGDTRSTNRPPRSSRSTRC